MPEETTKSIKSGWFWRVTELVKRGAVFTANLVSLFVF